MTKAEAYTKISELVHMRTNQEKLQTVLDKNTFYFFNSEFEESYEVNNINAVTNLLQNIQSEIRQSGIKKELFQEFLARPKGLRAILALNGFSNESLKRLITFLRLKNDEELER